MPTDSPQPIKRRKLSDEVKERMIETIQREALGPGDVLPSERELMARYGVGRPAIREAMQALQGMGLIEVRHGDRPRVAEPSMDGALSQIGLTMQHILAHSAPTLKHLKEARLGLETYLAGRAAEDRTDADIARIEDALEAHRNAPHGSKEFMIRDGLFHEAVAQTSDNPLYPALVHAIFNWLSVFHIGSVQQPGLEAVSLTEHTTIFEAIRDGNAELAREAMRVHLLRSSKLYQQSRASKD